MIGLLIFLAFIILLLLIFYRLYLSLEKNQDMILRMLANLDRHLSKRLELLAYFLALAKEDMTRDVVLIDEMFEIRKKLVTLKPRIDNTKERFELQHELDKKLQMLEASIPRYVELKSNMAFNNSYQELRKLDLVIQDSIKSYNKTLKALKNSIELFPSSILASLSDVKCNMSYYEEIEKPTYVNNNSNFFDK